MDIHISADEVRRYEAKADLTTLSLLDLCAVEGDAAGVRAELRRRQAMLDAASKLHDAVRLGITREFVERELRTFVAAYAAATTPAASRG